MEILSIDKDNPEMKMISEATNVLVNSGLVVYPTDTAYGLGGNALDEVVVKRIYDVKGRDFSKPTHVIVRDWIMIEELCITNEKAKKLYDVFLPGPLTIVLQKKEVVPSILVAGGTTLGVRIPKSTVTQQISSLLPFPYTTPSANISGGNTPYSIEEVLHELDTSKIDLFLYAGVLPQVAPSTVVDVSGDVVKIIRQGPIDREALEKVLDIKFQ